MTTLSKREMIKLRIAISLMGKKELVDTPMMVVKTGRRFRNAYSKTSLLITMVSRDRRPPDFYSGEKTNLGHAVIDWHRLYREKVMGTR